MIRLLVTAVLLAGAAIGQSPSVSQVLMYSATTTNLKVNVLNSSGTAVIGSFNLPRAIPSIYTQNAFSTVADNKQPFLSIITSGSNFTVSQNIGQLNNALNASIATALSIIPLSSPASGVIVKKDPVTGAELPVSGTLGPLFTERAETIGKGKLYVGISNQNFHFTKFNGTSLNALSILYKGNDPSKVTSAETGSAYTTVPATFGVGMDVRLSQNIAFITYGVTENLDVSLGLPMIHSAVSARTYNGVMYAGNGFLSNGSACWCVSTFTPGFPTLTQPDINQTSMAKSGLGDVLVRVKGTVLRKSNVVVALGGDLRLPTGDADNYLGVGTTTVKPFAAVSIYSKPMRNNIVLSPHFDIGWQFSGKSILGGQLQGTPLSVTTASGTVNYVGAPFTSTKDFLPDVFTWAAGAEVALGRHNTFVADLLGNQVGLIHGIPNASLQTISNLPLPTGPNGDSNGVAVPTKGSASGLVSDGRVSFGQYNASLGYKARLVGNLVFNFNLLVRLDDNGLSARISPMFGLGYSF